MGGAQKKHDGASGAQSNRNALSNAIMEEEVNEYVGRAVDENMGMGANTTVNNRVEKVQT